MLVPRWETAEWATRLAQEFVPLVVRHDVHEPCRIVDLCTGSGCVALLLAHLLQDADVVGCDIDPVCIRLAERNRDRVLQTDDRGRLSFVQRDIMSEGVETLLHGATVVVANPPYIDADADADISLSARRWEPRMALTADLLGDAFIDRILAITQTARTVKLMAVEVAGGEQALRTVLRAGDLWQKEVLTDSAGVQRCVVLRR